VDHVFDLVPLVCDDEQRLLLVVAVEQMESLMDDLDNADSTLQDVYDGIDELL
jgi:hypothetical protein